MPDDSAVYQLDDQRALISTVDFFPPVVDSPYDFGAIAAANALSDVYAMGGEPLMAINLLAFPDDLPRAIMTDILRGGAEKVREAGAVIAGGHTVVDKEPKYGLAVTGMVHPGHIKTKGNVHSGDALILTKALGTGVITTALKNQKAAPEHITAAVASMIRLNRDAARLAHVHGVHAMTDITGYGLLGHAREMIAAERHNFEIQFDALQWLPGASGYANQGIFPGGTARNQDYFESWVVFDDGLSAAQRSLLFDPQTSGGLLMALPAAKAPALLDALRAAGDESSCIMGEVREGDGKIRVII